MTEKQLKECVAILYDMECDLFFLDRAIRKLNHQIYGLGKSYSYTPPRQHESKFEFAPSLVAAMLGGVIGALIGLLSGCSNGNSPLNSLDQGISGFFSGAIVGGIIGLIVGVIFAIYCMKSEQDEYDRKYSQEYSEYAQRVHENELRVQRELKMREILLNEYAKLTKRRDETAALLDKFYNIIDIDENYRKLQLTIVIASQKKQHIKAIL